MRLDDIQREKARLSRLIDKTEEESQSLKVCTVAGSLRAWQLNHKGSKYFYEWNAFPLCQASCHS